MTRSEEIEAMTVTDEELKRAIWAIKFTKWNEERNRDRFKSNDDESKEMVSYKEDAPPVQAVKNMVEKRSKERWGKAFKKAKKRT